MKKTLKIGAVFCVILSGLAMVWAKAIKVEPTLHSVTIESQSKLYVSNCARCHGADGKGNTQLGQEMGIPDLTTSRMSSAGIKRIIRNGDGDMPGFSKKLKTAQINSLTTYVRSLRK